MTQSASYDGFSNNRLNTNFNNSNNNGQSLSHTNLTNLESSSLGNDIDEFEREPENPYLAKSSLLVSTKEQRKAQIDLFEDDTSFVRLKKYLEESSLGTNPIRYPPVEVKLTYDSDEGYNTDPCDSDKSYNELESIVTQKLLRRSDEDGLESNNLEKENSDDEIERMLKTPDYSLICNDDLSSSEAFDSPDFEELLKLFRISKDIASKNTKIFLVSGLESLEDLKEKKNILTELLDTNANDNTSAIRPKKRKEKIKSKPQSKPKKRAKSKQKTFDSINKDNYLGEGVSILDKDSNAHNSSQISEVFGDFGITRNSKITGSKSGKTLESDSDSEIQIPKAFGSSQRSQLISDYLQSSDEDSGKVNKSFKTFSKSRKSEAQNTKDNQKEGEPVEGISSFKERALKMRRRLIKEKSRKVLVRKSKYSDEENDLEENTGDEH
ncbi:hypothetical protein AYI68_g80 [Smittium mucronatum]|uniref:Uncharacterized protein n=1 Tax=Smittium mucronatum TaxID=133383 RepID=A0A1R0H9D6_9FUNG|nr:hypothetical protein AYI68_g80 [Smittium mucronatum]